MLLCLVNDGFYDSKFLDIVVPLLKMNCSSWHSYRCRLFWARGSCISMYRSQ